tara:strand:+ start:261 stop:506 length:246 start_codon:yes stop_codon:yes gene_type:complete
MNTYKEIKDTLVWEWGMTLQHDYNGRLLDLKTTAKRILGHLEGNGTLASIEAMPEDWQKMEATHQATTDWLSSYEPTTRED